MKIYVAPKAAVLSMNVKENIAASSEVTFNGTYFYNAGTGRVMTSDFVYTGDTYVGDLMNWLRKVFKLHGEQYWSDQNDLLDRCLVSKPDAK